MMSVTKHIFHEVRAVQNITCLQDFPESIQSPQTLMLEQSFTHSGGSPDGLHLREHTHTLFTISKKMEGLHTCQFLILSNH